MGFRFQKRIKIAPGLSINLSKSGVSTSVGTRGARMTFGHGKRRTTVGLPGTGISHTSITSAREELTSVDDTSGEPSSEGLGWVKYVLILFFILLAIAIFGD